MAPAPAASLLAPAFREWTVHQNLGSNKVELRVINNEPRIRLQDHGLELGREVQEVYSYQNNDYATVRGFVEQIRHFKRDDWDIRTITRTTMTSTEDCFQIRATLDAYEGDARIFARSWDENIPRKLV